MKLARPLIVLAMIFGVSTAGFAGDLRESLARAAQQPAPSQEHAPKIDTPYVISGATLFVVGMAMATYGFLHTSGGDFVSGEVSKESKTGLGGAGLAVAAAGGAILYVGAQRAKKAPSLTLAPHRVTISKQVSW
jgi:hypothetical protein